MHPSFGFLSERAELARRCATAGIVFLGSNPDATDIMGNKIWSKIFAAKAGVSTVRGHEGEIDTIATAVRMSEEVGCPVMIKVSAGAVKSGSLEPGFTQALFGVVAVADERPDDDVDDREVRFASVRDLIEAHVEAGARQGRSG